MNWPEQVLVMSECIIVWAGARAVLKLPVICCKRLLMSFRWAALGEAGGRKNEKTLTLNCTLCLCLRTYFPSFDQSSLFGRTIVARWYYFGVITSLTHIVLHFQSLKRSYVQFLLVISLFDNTASFSVRCLKPI